MKFTVRPKKTYYLEEPKCLKEGLVWHVGNTNHGTSVYQIEGIGEWEAPGGSWFSIIDHAFVFAVHSRNARPRLSKQIRTLEDLVFNVNRMLVKLLECNGFLSSSTWNRHLLNTRLKSDVVVLPKEGNLPHRRCFCFTTPSSLYGERVYSVAYTNRKERAIASADIEAKRFQFIEIFQTLFSIDYEQVKLKL